MIDCLCFFFLFSLLTTKLYNCHLYLLFVNFSLYSLNFLFHFYSFYRSFVFFSILSFNYNFLYVLFFISILILLIFFYSYSFYSFSSPKSVPILFFWCFRIHPLSFDFLFRYFSLLFEFYVFTI
jgi:hypothetical protein